MVLTPSLGDRAGVCPVADGYQRLPEGGVRGERKELAKKQNRPYPVGHGPVVVASLDSFTVANCASHSSRWCDCPSNGRTCTNCACSTDVRNCSLGCGSCCGRGCCWNGCSMHGCCCRASLFHRRRPCWLFQLQKFRPRQKMLQTTSS